MPWPALGCWVSASVSYIDVRACLHCVYGRHRRLRRSDDQVCTSLLSLVQSDIPSTTLLDPIQYNMGIGFSSLTFALPLPLLFSEGSNLCPLMKRSVCITAPYWLLLG